MRCPHVYVLRLGDFLEGGVRVPAFAWWPGTIAPGQLVGDIVHITDLFTTFASLANATDAIPRDRIIDGIDQTSLLLNGDTSGRRDHVFIYTNDQLGAIVKNTDKLHMRSSAPGADSGVAAASFDLLNDPREESPMLINMLPKSEGFRRMHRRHLAHAQAFPHSLKARGAALTGIENARPQTVALSLQPAVGDEETSVHCVDGLCTGT
jgi:arylsulfatase